MVHCGDWAEGCASTLLLARQTVHKYTSCFYEYVQSFRVMRGAFPRIRSNAPRIRQVSLRKYTACVRIRANAYAAHTVLVGRDCRGGSVPDSDGCIDTHPSQGMVQLRVTQACAGSHGG